MGIQKLLETLGHTIKLHELEKEYIKALLVSLKANKRETAKVLGMSEKTLYNKIRKHSLEKEAGWLR